MREEHGGWREQAIDKDMWPTRAEYRVQTMDNIDGKTWSRDCRNETAQNEVFGVRAAWTDHSH